MLHPDSSLPLPPGTTGRGMPPAPTGLAHAAQLPPGSSKEGSWVSAVRVKPPRHSWGAVSPVMGAGEVAPLRRASPALTPRGKEASLKGLWPPAATGGVRQLGLLGVTLSSAPDSPP